jgi:hypothetical protein
VRLEGDQARLGKARLEVGAGWWRHGNSRDWRLRGLGGVWVHYGRCSLGALELDYDRSGLLGHGLRNGLDRGRLYGGIRNSGNGLIRGQEGQFNALGSEVIVQKPPTGKSQQVGQEQFKGHGLSNGLGGGWGRGVVD